VYGWEAVLPIECEIPSLKLAVKLLPNTSVEEELFLHLTQLYETCCDVALANEMNKKCFKYQYNKTIRPRVFSEGDMVLVYDHDRENLWDGKFYPLWHVPYIVKRVLEKGAYELVDYDGFSLGEPINGLYLKWYYS